MATVQTLRAIGQHVWLQPISAEGVSAGGIILPHADKVQTLRGIILSVGPDVRRGSGANRALDAAADVAKELGDSTIAGTIALLKEDPGLSEGDEVIYAKYGGQEFVIEGFGKTVMIEASQIFAVVVRHTMDPEPAAPVAGSSEGNDDDTTAR